MSADYDLWMAQAETLGLSPDRAREEWEVRKAIPSDSAWQPREFHCPRWPGCGCPDGTIALDCPGRTVVTDPVPVTPVPANDAAGAPDNPLKARAKTILGDLRAALQKSDDALWALHTELGERRALLDAAFTAHVETGFISRDLNQLIRDL